MAEMLDAIHWPTGSDAWKFAHAKYDVNRVTRCERMGRHTSHFHPEFIDHFPTPPLSGID